MDIRTELNFTDAKAISLSVYPTEQGCKSVLVLSAPLMPAEADILGCSYIYKDSIPVAGLEDVALDGQLRDMELLLPTPQDLNQFDLYRPELLHKFKIKRSDDARFEVTFRVHEASRRADLICLLEAVNKSTFSFQIRSRQGQLFGESGTRVEMAAAAVASEGGSSETTPPEAETTDRSYETRPRGGRRKKVQSIAEPVAEAVAEEQTDPEVDDLPFIN